MVKDVTFTGVDESLLKEDSEQALYKAALPVYTTNRNALEAGDYVKAVSLAESLVPYIETFFEHVMVMDKRRNSEAKSSSIITYDLRSK